ncbi:hypothetical protein BGZ76_010982 [Entomortierella beljakovae]|nr:hypothetical protein BGZ76_010982 [Entomortierella beljakovae]
MVVFPEQIEFWKIDCLAQPVWHELDQWNEGVIAFDDGLYEEALEIFEPIADSAKIHFNIGVVLATLGDFDGASKAYEQATNLDQYLAIAYFQNGVANVALEDYRKALTCFHDAYLYLRGNMVIDYTQLGLDFKLYSCQVLFNRALCYIELGEMDMGMADMWRATREKQTKAHDILDQALRDKGQDSTVFTVPQGVLYRPAESKVKNSKKKDYLGNSKVIAAVDATDEFAGFKGKSAWQVQVGGPTNVASEQPRSTSPPAGLQRRATERAPQGGGRSRNDQERPPLEYSASFNGNDMPRRGSNNLGPAGSESSGRPSLLTRRNTEMQRSTPSTGRSRFQDDLDEIDQQVNALAMDDRDMRRPGVYRKPSQSSKISPQNGNQSIPPVPSMLSYSTSPPISGRSSPSQSDLRRMGSNGRGLNRGDSVRSTASSNGMFRSLPLHGVSGSPLAYSSSTAGSVAGRSDDGSYADEPLYAPRRDKLRVKCHYIDTRAVLVKPDTTIQELIQRVQEKFQSERPLKLKYKDEDQHMLSMVDDEDWIMAQQVHRETTGSLDRMELWCFDDD